VPTRESSKKLSLPRVLPGRTLATCHDFSSLARTQTPLVSFAFDRRTRREPGVLTHRRNAPRKGLLPVQAGGSTRPIAARPKAYLPHAGHAGGRKTLQRRSAECESQIRRTPISRDKFPDKPAALTMGTASFKLGEKKTSMTSPSQTSSRKLGKDGLQSSQFVRSR